MLTNSFFSVCRCGSFLEQIPAVARAVVNFRDDSMVLLLRANFIVKNEAVFYYYFFYYFLLLFLLLPFLLLKFPTYQGIGCAHIMR